jgi:hypothetical protein
MSRARTDGGTGAVLQPRQSKQEQNAQASKAESEDEAGHGQHAEK